VIFGLGTGDETLTLYQIDALNLISHEMNEMQRCCRRVLQFDSGVENVMKKYPQILKNSQRIPNLYVSMQMKRILKLKSVLL